MDILFAGRHDYDESRWQRLQWSCLYGGARHGNDCRHFVFRQRIYDADCYATCAALDRNNPRFGCGGARGSAAIHCYGHIHGRKQAKPDSERLVELVVNFGGIHQQFGLDAGTRNRDRARHSDGDRNAGHHEQFSTIVSDSDPWQPVARVEPNRDPNGNTLYHRRPGVI